MSDFYPDEIKIMMKIYFVILLTLFLMGCSLSKDLPKPWQKQSSQCKKPEFFNEKHLYFTSVGIGNIEDSGDRQLVRKKNEDRLKEYFFQELRSYWLNIAEIRSFQSYIPPINLTLNDISESFLLDLTDRLMDQDWSEIPETKNHDDLICSITRIKNSELTRILKAATTELDRRIASQKDHWSNPLKQKEIRIQEGQLIEALQIINNLELPSEDEGTDLASSLRKAEAYNLALRVVLLPLGIIEREFNQGEGTNQFVVQVLYQNGNKPIALKDYPIEFITPNYKEPILTDSNGEAWFKPFKRPTTDRFYIFIKTDISRFPKTISPEIIKEFELKTVRFRVFSGRQDILSGKIRNDFPLELNTSNDNSSQIIDKPFKIIAKCPKNECFIKLFGFETDRDVVVLEDMNNRILKKGKTISLDINPPGIGQTTYAVIASLERFNTNFKKGEILKRKEFKKLISNFRKQTSPITENSLTITVVDE